jgi:hypothetical protein
MQTARTKMIYFILVLTIKIKLRGKVVQSHLIKRGFKRNYTIWTKYGEIDDTLHEVDIGVGDNNFDGVFDGNDHDVADDDDFDYQELLYHIK